MTRVSIIIINCKVIPENANKLKSNISLISILYTFVDSKLNLPNDFLTHTLKNQPINFTTEVYT